MRTGAFLSSYSAEIVRQWPAHGLHHASPGVTGTVCMVMHAASARAAGTEGEGKKDGGFLQKVAWFTTVVYSR